MAATDEASAALASWNVTPATKAMPGVRMFTDR
jgi:hypothetical protein